jgi:acyl-CoA synthetase (AMP-forming)/AMP-acid ligase II
MLQDAGVRPGQVCATILRHHREFYPLYMAIDAAGALPAVLAYPNNRLHPDKFRQGLSGMAARSGLDWILTERDLEETVRPLLTGAAPGAASAIKSLLFPLEWTLPDGPVDVPHPPVSPDAPCLLQHSSGTTGLQKPVMLSHRAVLEHVRRYGRAIALSPTDRVCSWLPLYHDMGLIAAFHMPLAAGITTIQLDPFEWVAAPVLLLEALSQHKATLCWLPNFAYNHMAERIHEEDTQGLRLDSVRLLINCSEPVRADSHERFLARFAALGLKRTALSACYAMAETTYAVTQTTVGIEAPWLDADRAALAAGRCQAAAPGAPARRCVSSGSPIDGCAVRIVDENRRDLPDGIIGEVAIRSVSMFDGYRNNPEQTAQVLADGWYFSGDFGFRVGTQHYIIGRKKDIIIVAGKNLYPEDIEDAVNGAAGVLPGRAVAFGVEDDVTGTEAICIVAETAATGADRKAVRRAIIEAGMRIDVTISRVYLAEPRWLIKSSAGKPSRSANRQRAVDELTLEE